MSLKDTAVNVYHKLAADFYHAYHSLINGEVDFYSKHFKKNDCILEPMCGSGRLLAPMFQAGFNIEGVDKSSTMLKKLRAQFKADAKLPVLHEQDLETLDIGTTYNHVIVPYCSLSHITDLESVQTVFSNIYKHLVPGGSFRFEIFHGNRFTWATKSLVRETQDMRETCTDVIQDNALYTVTYLHERLDENKNVVESSTETQTFRLFNLEWTHAALEKAGFTQIKTFSVEEVYNDPDYTSQTGDTIFFEAFKPL